ncbi:MAG: hypothetical protein JWN84_305 [Nocardioides sp.]|nr:hypothetical protein [Nocardioides sp.]
MRRTLTALLAAAAVVGSTAGTVTAVRLGADGVDRRDARSAAASAVDPAGSVGSDDESPEVAPDPRADQPLWLVRQALHDGDIVVEVNRTRFPHSLQRYDGGWVLTELIDEDNFERETLTIAPDGEVTPIAETLGDGEVSPDGRRWVALALDGSGYGVWDLATGERVETIAEGRTPEQKGAGGAQFVDADTIATAWSAPDRATEVLLSDLGSAERTVLADDLDPQTRWSVSPDGQWYAGTVRVDDPRAPSCVVVRPVDGSSAGRTDCGGVIAGFPGLPRFALDSSAVLTVPADRGEIPGLLRPFDWRPVPTGDNPVPPRIPSPDDTYDGVYLGDGRLAVLGTKEFDISTDGVRVFVCDAAGCDLVGTSENNSLYGVLGSGY